jgi:hypothetical protein
MTMNALDHLERLLSITEQFKPQLGGKDLDWWQEASAFCADEMEGTDDVADDVQYLAEQPHCECDNGHEQNDTVCRWCWAHGRRHWNDPEAVALITAEQVQEAYQKTGLRPVRGTFTKYAEDFKQCGCGLTACAIAKGLDFDLLDDCWGGNKQSSIADYLSLSQEYTKGFADGFDADCDEVIPEPVDIGPDFFRGFADGRAAGLAVFGY